MGCCTTTLNRGYTLSSDRLPIESSNEIETVLDKRDNHIEIEETALPQKSIIEKTTYKSNYIEPPSNFTLCTALTSDSISKEVSTQSPPTRPKYRSQTNIKFPNQQVDSSGLEDTSMKSSRERKYNRGKSVNFAMSQDIELLPELMIVPTTSSRDNLESLKCSTSSENILGIKKTHVRRSATPLNTRYKLLSKIGKGVNSEVYKALDRELNIERAVKIVDIAGKTQASLVNILKNIDLHEMLDHPHILKVVEVIRNMKTLHIVTELCQGGVLLDRIMSVSYFSEPRTIVYLYQIISALIYCHSMGIEHGDLQPNNIMILDHNYDSPIKLIGFKRSKLDSIAKIEQDDGSIYYIAPELFDDKYTFKTDIWSCGVIMYIMLSGYPPFNGNTKDEIVHSIRTGKYSFEGKEWVKVSQEAKQLIMSMLSINPNLRPSAYQVLQHPWFKTLNKREVDNQVASMTLENLSHFKNSCKLRNAVLEMIATQMTSEEEKANISRLFVQLDKNGDGKLSREEILQGFKDYVNLPKKQFKKILSDCDANGDGYIDFTEFLKATLNWKRTLSHERLLSAFKALDTDNSGKISLNEIREFLGPNHSEWLWEKVLIEADTNGDGEV